MPNELNIAERIEKLRKMAEGTDAWERYLKRHPELSPENKKNIRKDFLAGDFAKYLEAEAREREKDEVVPGIEVNVTENGGQIFKGLEEPEDDDVYKGPGWQGHQR